MFIDQYLEHPDMQNLYGLIDCFVSPHRAEGLGLTIVEAMAAGKPIVATAYGGLTDYANMETAYLVDYQLIKVGLGRDPYPGQFVWADPLQSSLRAAMRKVFRYSDAAIGKGLKGQAQVRRMFSLDSVDAVREEINRIWSRP
jgi:glycosyltransferase involved in cell wall biosynthesis